MCLCPHCRATHPPEGLPLPRPPRPAEDMKPRFRQALQDKLAETGAAFKMADLSFKSFQLQVGRGGRGGRVVTPGGRAGLRNGPLHGM